MVRRTYQLMQLHAIKDSYAHNITDEFIKPTIIVKNGEKPNNHKRWRQRSYLISAQTDAERSHRYFHKRHARIRNEKT